jgi:hypothetical protein
LARGAHRWVFSGDTVSFDWEFDATKTYRNILTKTLKTRDGRGSPVVRGDRTIKQRWRTTPARMPGSRREQRD